MNTPRRSGLRELLSALRFELLMDACGRKLSRSLRLPALVVEDGKQGWIGGALCDLLREWFGEGLVGGCLNGNRL